MAGVSMPQLIILYFVIAYFVSWWPFQEERWEGFVYPDKSELTIHKNIGEFKSLESCRSAAQNKLIQISSLERGDYECGLNCEFNSNYDMNVCKETKR
jgi:hypothetical protein